MRFGVKGIQKGLTSTKIYGIPLDPKRENVLQALVEKRQQIKNEMKKFLEGASEHKMLDAQQKALKILNSATGYGINVELHPENTHEWVKIYSDTEFKSFGAYEKPGTYFNPIIGACITAGARLLLGIAEKYVTDKGEMHAYMDTDSIFVPPYLANELVELFKSLNPYSFDRSILEIEDGMEDIWFYGISSKRYCLFRKRGNIIIIPEGKKRFYKLHGLGHLTDPFGRELIEDHRWEKEFWHDILRLHYDPTLEEEILEKYDDAAAISKLTVTTGNILTKFKVVNRRKPFRKRIKPFNFILVGYGTTVNVDGEIIKPIAPYHNNPQEAVEEKFVDYKSGKVLQGRHYWKTLGDVFWEYINHPESKYEGDVGILRRRLIVPEGGVYIGKEANKIEMGPLEGYPLEQYPNMLELRKFIEELTPTDAKSLGIKYRSTLRKLKERAGGSKLNLNTKMMRNILKYYMKKKCHSDS